MNESSEIVVVPIPTDKRFVNLIGRKFGRLEVTSFAGTQNKHRYWNCVCECGGIKTIEGGSLKYGETTSCGCFNRERLAISKKTHGATIGGKRLAEYNIWAAMKRRCYNKNVKDYHRYGGRGIKVCDEWMSFKNFYADMGARPSPKHSIDRYPDKDGDYKKSNCRWATLIEQANNTRRNRMITYGGLTGTISSVARGLGVKERWLWGLFRPTRKSQPPPFSSPAIEHCILDGDGS